VLPDSAIIAAVKANPKQLSDLLVLPVFSGPRQRRHAAHWFSALAAGRDVPEADLPPVSAISNDPDAMPAPARWRDKDPEAAARLAACKDVVAVAAEEHSVLSQNLLAGEILRRLAWRPVSPLIEDAVRERLTELGARRWQVDLLAADLTKALGRPVT
jgi:ribonuclease D